MTDDDVKPGIAELIAVIGATEPVKLHGVVAVA